MNLLKTNVNLLAITEHWIDDEWNLHEALLNFQHIQSHHTEEYLD